MKDILITGKAVRRELFILLGCFVAAFCINAGAIIGYGRPAQELFTMIGYVLFITLLVYLLLWIVRLLILAIASLFRKRKG